MSVAPTTPITVAEYLAGERISTEKHEYWQGAVYALAGGSRNHNLIVANLIGELHAQLKTRSCTVFPSDMRVKVSATGLYTYPDVSAVSGEAWFDDADNDTLLNPTIIIEVLSPSTEHYDRGGKFQQYRRIASLREYLLIDQHTYHIEQYVRQADHQWLLIELDGVDATVSIAAIGCTLTAGEIYAKVGLSEV